MRRQRCNHPRMSAARDALVDRAEITELVISLARAQDDRNWEFIRQCFCPETTLDLSQHLDQAARLISPAELAEGMRVALAGFDWTEHLTSNITIELDGDRARARTYVHAYHRLEDDTQYEPFCAMRGRWEQELVRFEGRWRIRSWTVRRVGPIDGDPELYAKAAAKVSTSRAAEESQ
jgi:SnoaL-like domain